MSFDAPMVSYYFSIVNYRRKFVSVPIGRKLSINESLECSTSGSGSTVVRSCHLWHVPLIHHKLREME